MVKLQDLSFIALVRWEQDRLLRGSRALLELGEQNPSTEIETARRLEKIEKLEQEGKKEECKMCKARPTSEMKRKQEGSCRR